MKHILHSRRQVIVGVGVAGAAVIAPNIAFSQRGPLVVETTNGRVQGLDVDGIAHFRGIPYGCDTSGKNRFMPPTPPVAWSGVRDCTTWGHVAPQPNNANPNAYDRMTGWTNYRGGMSEDCLVVNVWTPAADTKKRAVMVMIHGGGFTGGSGNLVALEGKFMARAGDMVVVSLTHRLGALGYLDLSAWRELELASSGLVGIMDLTQALRWVRDNIAAFGGDPARIAVSGQSGGGRKVSTLLAMPSARGLIHRAAVQSGSTLRVQTHETAQQNAQKLLDKLGIARGDLARLQSLPVEQIIAAQAGFEPVVDGKILPRQPFDPDAPAVSADVPMIIGTCLEDFGFALADRTDTDESLRAYAEQQAPGHGAEVISAYRRLYPEKRPNMIKSIIATHTRVTRNAVAQAERKAALGRAPVYAYRWDWPVPGAGGQFGATHGADLSLSMSNPTTPMTLDTPQARVMAKRIGSAFIAFAKTGDPNTSAIPKWPAYLPDRRAVMIFDTDTRVVDNPDLEARQLWDRLSSNR